MPSRIADPRDEMAAIPLEPMDQDEARQPPAFNMNMRPPQNQLPNQIRDENVSDTLETHMVDNASLDVEQYAQQYSGYAKVQRLEYIADHCLQLRAEALTLLLKYIQENTYDVATYQKTVAKLAEIRSESNASGNYAAAQPDLICNDMSGSSADKQWVEQATKRGQLRLDKLDQDLKHHKSNSIKESIRRGQDELGEHFLLMGNLNNALKCFSRSRDYCSSTKNVVQMCFNVIRVSVYLKNWSLVSSYVLRADSPLTSIEPTGREATNYRNQSTARWHAASGLADLALKRYKQAAKSFLQVSFDSYDYPDMMAARDIAVYGSLCALASFDRAELQKLVIANTGFKQFLELEPQLNDVLRRFNASEYQECLQLLDDMRPNLMLDIYAARHVPALYSSIRKRGIIQYFSPYLSADMRKMAVAFNTTLNSLEDELTGLILDGEIRARIDSQMKIIYSADVDERAVAYTKAMNASKLMQRHGQAIILRAAISKAKINVRMPRGSSAGAFSQPFARGKQSAAARLANALPVVPGGDDSNGNQLNANVEDDIDDDLEVAAQASDWDGDNDDMNDSTLDQP